jgi:hypothetical protein
MFGMLYGLSAVALYQLLGAAGVPTFFDKLLQVPILNLTVKRLDRASRARWLEVFDPARLGRSLTARQRHLAYLSVWAVVFALMSASQAVGDRHPGQWLPFWERACRDGRPRACAYIANVESMFCNAGSGWACNEAVILQDERVAAARGSSRWDPSAATASFQRGCRLGFVPACRNEVRLANGTRPFERMLPTLADYRILLRGSKGPITERSPSAMHARACEQGWSASCGQTASLIRD